MSRFKGKHLANVRRGCHSASSYGSAEWGILGPKNFTAPYFAISANLSDTANGPPSIAAESTTGRYQSSIAISA
jgi:hypothetical protein